MTLRDLMLRGRALVNPRRAEGELDDELAFHVECETRKLVDRGLDPLDARRQALARFGSRTATADDCRDERGTGGIDVVVRDLRYAVRTWRRAPAAALTIILTVALGLGLVTIAFTAFNAMFLRPDAVPHPEELFELYRPPQAGAATPMSFTQAEFETFRQRNASFRDVAAAAGDSDMRIDGREAASMLVSGEFFCMAGVPAASGRTLSAVDDQAGAPPVIVLSDRGWAKWFGRDAAVIGRTLRVNGVAVEIVGVMPDGFRGLHISTPDFWASLATAPLFRGSDAAPPGERPVELIGRLRAGTSQDEAAGAVRQWAAGPGFRSIDGRPLAVTLRPKTGVSPDAWVGMLALGTPLFFVFGTILLIACANVASLLLARGVARQQELGVRLSLGATRRRLLRQLLTEGLVLGAAAAGLAYPISRMLSAGVWWMVLRSVPPEFSEQIHFSLPEADWRVLVFLIVGAVAATVMFGLMPALQATTLDPVRTMRGEVIRDARPGSARRSLMVAQVGASTLLLICAAIFLRGVITAGAADPGVRTVDTLTVAIGSEQRRAAVLDALRADPLVTIISAWSELDGKSAAVRAVDTGIVASHTYQFVSSNHFAALDIGLLRGRPFSDSERSLDSGVVILSTHAAQRLWPGADPIGRAVRLSVTPPADGPAGTAPPAPEHTFTVIGVTRDLRLAFGAGPGLYLPTTVTSPGMRLIVRVNEDPLRARTRLMEQLTRLDPRLSSVRTVRAIFGGVAAILRVAFLVAVALGGVALLLTVSGLFSVLSFLVQQRRKEIGVRMALGASRGAVARLVLTDSARPVVVGASAAVLLAAGAAGALMATPFAGDIGGIVQVLDPMAYVAALLVIVAACAAAASAPALRAARVDPNAMLRQE